MCASKPKVKTPAPAPPPVPDAISAPARLMINNKKKGGSFGAIRALAIQKLSG